MEWPYTPRFFTRQIFKEAPSKPFFIIHSKEDRNCLFKTTAEFVAKFKQQNSDVIFSVDESNGHSGTNEVQANQIIIWLKNKSLL